MKFSSQIIVCLAFLLMATFVNAQITFNACNPLLEDQDFTFTVISTDGTGRNVFETSPIVGDQDCGGIGVCEMQIAWDDGSSRWEIYADDGNGAFVNKYILYYNTEPSIPNPPSLILGTWVENTVITESLCVDGISEFSGDVQVTTLSVSEIEIEQIFQIYPNPASDVINIVASGNAIQSVTISDINGRIVYEEDIIDQQIDVSRLERGLYFVQVQDETSQLIKKIILR